MSTDMKTSMLNKRKRYEITKKLEKIKKKEQGNSMPQASVEICTDYTDTC